MTILIEKKRNFSAVEQPPHWNDMKLKLAPQAAVRTECTCTVQHMAVHDAMCPHCWAKLIERSRN